MTHLCKGLGEEEVGEWLGKSRIWNMVEESIGEVVWSHAGVEDP